MTPILKKPEPKPDAAEVQRRMQVCVAAPVEKEPDPLREIDGLFYLGPNDLMNAINAGAITLPVWVRLGQSRYKITNKTKKIFSIAVLMATDGTWRDL